MRETRSRSRTRSRGASEFVVAKMARIGGAGAICGNSRSFASVESEIGKNSAVLVSVRERRVESSRGAGENVKGECMSTLGGRGVHFEGQSCLLRAKGHGQGRREEQCEKGFGVHWGCESAEGGE